MPDAKTDFEKNLPEKIASDPEFARGIGAIFHFTVTGDGGGVWTVDCKDNPGVYPGEQGDPDCTIQLTVETWQTMSDDPSRATALYFQGKLKVGGDVMKATKLQALLE